MQGFNISLLLTPCFGVHKKAVWQALGVVPRTATPAENEITETSAVFIAGKTKDGMMTNVNNITNARLCKNPPTDPCWAGKFARTRLIDDGLAEMVNGVFTITELGKRVADNFFDAVKKGTNSINQAGARKMEASE